MGKDGVGGYSFQFVLPSLNIFFSSSSELRSILYKVARDFSFLHICSKRVLLAFLRLGCFVFVFVGRDGELAFLHFVSVISFSLFFGESPRGGLVTFAAGKGDHP